MNVYRWPACVLALLLMLAGGVQAEAQAPLANEVILIIRHAEKPEEGSGLTPAGELRAKAYVRYFEAYMVDGKPRIPDCLVATADSANSERPRLTLTPLSQALNLPIDSRFADKDVTALVQAIDAHPGGKTILICWHHKEIPALLDALGADTEALVPGGKWPGSVFNWVIQLSYDASGRLIAARERRINEHLFPGDSD